MNVAAIAVVSAVATLIAMPLVPAGLPILLAAAVGGAIGWFSHVGPMKGFSRMLTRIPEVNGKSLLLDFACVRSVAGMA